MMTLSDVRSIQKEHDIGSHSFSHESMGYESDAFFEEDLDESVRLFENDLGVPLRTYAFPNGSFRQEQIAILQRRGVRTVLLVEEKLARTSDSPAESRVYPRLSIAGGSAAETRFQALGYHARGSM
jgi:peptidoglycan/xylan/chitin deacetylase (PgdA/CDA1 family)